MKMESEREGIELSTASGTRPMGSALPVLDAERGNREVVRDPFTDSITDRVRQSDIHKTFHLPSKTT
jgi:hypothetical protein